MSEDTGEVATVQQPPTPEDKSAPVDQSVVSNPAAQASLRSQREKRGLNLHAVPEKKPDGTPSSSDNGGVANEQPTPVSMAAPVSEKAVKGARTQAALRAMQEKGSKFTVEPTPPKPTQPGEPAK